jgi:hypothetical protein
MVGHFVMGGEFGLVFYLCNNALLLSFLLLSFLLLSFLLLSFLLLSFLLLSFLLLSVDSVGGSDEACVPGGRELLCSLRWTDGTAAVVIRPPACGSTSLGARTRSAGEGIGGFIKATKCSSLRATPSSLWIVFSLFFHSTLE